MMEIILIIITIISLIAGFPTLGGSMETTNDITKMGKDMVASDYPVFISTIYLIPKNNPQLIHTMPRIEDAFNMWGKTITPTPPGEFAFFTSPLSYPFEFTDQGIEIISDKLKSIPEVEQQSITLKSFPNVALVDQQRYPDIFTKDLIVEERYISFKLKNWEKVEFNRFPTFLVISFDYSMENVNSPKLYAEVSKYWRKKVEAFNNNQKLKDALGFPESNYKSREIPIFTFVSAVFYRDAKYINRYFGGGEDTKGKFLSEVSLRPSMAEQVRLMGLDWLYHEYDRLTRWRFYYSTEPFFYLGDWRRRTYPGGVYGPSAKLSQVLRTALFTHIVLPNTAKQCQSDLSETEKTLLKLRKKRIDFVDHFSRKDLSDFQLKVIGIIKEHTSVQNNAERAEEVLIGLESFKLFMNSAFEVQRKDTFESSDDVPVGIFSQDLVNEFFHYKHEAVLHNDRGKANRFRRLIQNRLDKIQKTASHLQKEISEASSLLESRRNMIESEKNTVLAIIIPALGALLFGFIWLMWSVLKR